MNGSPVHFECTRHCRCRVKASMKTSGLDFVSQLYTISIQDFFLAKITLNRKRSQFNLHLSNSEDLFISTVQVSIYLLCLSLSRPEAHFR